jgi:hypothetical protein
MYREEQLACDALGQPLLLPSAPLEEEVSILDNLDDELTCVSDAVSQELAAELVQTPPDPSLWTGHETEALRVPWGAADDGDGLRWELVVPGTQGLDLSEYDDFGFRAGRRTGPLGDRAPFGARVILDTGMLDDLGEGPIRVPLVYDRLVAQDNSFGARGTFMHTVRFPLGDFCAPDEGLDITDVRAVEIVATAPGDDASLLHIDSLEFTDSEFGFIGNACPTELGVWACEATVTLVATETSCADEPISGVCSNGDIETNPVALPHVALGGGFDGWLIVSPRRGPSGAANRSVLAA